MTLAPRSIQLDVFRGLAAVLMVVNHSGYQLLGPLASAGWAGAAVFVGSVAPALFFFATGVGSGLARGGAERTPAVARKVALLLLADVFLNWSVGVVVGFDFFAFAALATLALHLVRRSAHPQRLAAAGLVGVLALRFGLAPIAKQAIGTGTAWSFLTGIGFVDHVSYPLAPWLAFPLAGFLVGRAWPTAPARRETLSAIVLAVVAAAGCVLVQARGGNLGRWGEVSIGWFLIASAIVAGFWLLAHALSRVLGERAGALMLRGPASLLVVPLHYAALRLVRELCPPPWEPLAWLGATALLAAAVVVVVRRAAPALTAAQAGSGAAAEWGLLGGALLVAAAGLLWAPPALRLELACAAQVAVAAVLARPRPAAPPQVASAQAAPTLR